MRKLKNLIFDDLSVLLKKLLKTVRHIICEYFWRNWFFSETKVKSFHQSETSLGKRGVEATIIASKQHHVYGWQFVVMSALVAFSAQLASMPTGRWTGRRTKSQKCKKTEMTVLCRAQSCLAHVSIRTPPVSDFDCRTGKTKTYGTHSSIGHRDNDCSPGGRCSDDEV